MESLDATGPLKFGAFELDVRLRELRRGTTRIRLQEQPFEILRLMLERPGDIVTREQLRQRLWPAGTYVDFEHSLNAAVKRLRAALGDDAEHPRFVETLPRRGYRFIAPLGSVAEPPPACRPAAPRLRLAVLPFSNLSEDPAQEYFSDGLTEEMISQLGGLCRGRVGVLARWSSMVFKGTSRRAREIGEALRADYLLEGSVRREGDRVRVTARLIETEGETQLWSDTYERNLTDCLSVQSDVAAHIARALAFELAPAGPPERRAPCDPAAYQTYLKGRYYWNKSCDDGLDQAIAYYERAIAAAPSFGAAYAALARACIARAEYYYQLPRLALKQAQVSASRALSLDRSLYEACLAEADARRMHDLDWSGAESAYTQAIALNPSYESAHRGYGMMLSVLGRHGEAIRESERACELDPLCLVVGTTAAWVRYAAGDYDAAIDHCRNTIDMDPEFMAARRLLGAAYLQSGRGEDAIAELHSAAALVEDDPILLACLAHASAVTGSRSDAVSLIARVRRLGAERYVSPYYLALASVGLGDLDAAFAALDQAWLDRDPALALITVEPRFAPIRSDRRYGELLGRLKLPRD
jgi:TolB-like protein/Flp pilus assembly protein TadD